MSSFEMHTPEQQQLQAYEIRDYSQKLDWGIQIRMDFNMRTADAAPHFKPLSGASYNSFPNFLDYLNQYWWPTRPFGPTRKTFWSHSFSNFVYPSFFMSFPNLRCIWSFFMNSLIKACSTVLFDFIPPCSNLNACSNKVNAVSIHEKINAAET